MKNVAGKPGKKVIWIIQIHQIFRKIITLSVKEKANVVEKDFTERNIRAYLNLGHTFAHAYETIMGLGAVTHGEAVAWGIGRAITYSYKKDYCREAFYNRIIDVLKLYNWDTDPIPSLVRGGGIGARFLSVMHKDKKNILVVGIFRLLSALTIPCPNSSYFIQKEKAL